MVRDLGHPHLRPRVRDFHLLRRALNEGHYGNARIIAVLVIQSPLEIVENDFPLKIEHSPTDYRVMQNVNGYVGSVDIDEIELGSLLS